MDATAVTQLEQQQDVARSAAARKARLLPTRKLTWAHEALQRRPAALEEARAAMAAIAAELATQLGVPVTLEANLAESTLHPFSHLARGTLVVVLELAGGAAAALEIDALCAGLLLKHAAGTNELTAPLSLSRIEEAAFGWLCLSALSALRRAQAFSLRYGPRLVGVGTDRGAALERLDCRQRHLAVTINLCVGDGAGQLRLLVPALAVQRAVEGLEVAAPAQPAREVLGAALPVSLRAGVHLGRAEVSRLAPNDVIVFPSLRADGGLTGAATLIAPTFTLPVSLTPEGLTLSSPQEPAMADDPTLSVDVEVELTRLRLPLGDLGLLRAGQLLPLHVNGAQPVVLRIGDKAVAKAELVEIEGSLGARIIALL